MKERAAELIGKIKNATAGKVLSIYMVVRILASAMSIRTCCSIAFTAPTPRAVAARAEPAWDWPS